MNQTNTHASSALPLPAEIERLRAINLELVEVLDRIVSELPSYGLQSHAMYISAVHVLAKARSAT